MHRAVFSMTLLSFLTAAPRVMANPEAPPAFRYVLASSTGNQVSQPFTLTNHNLPGTPRTPWSIRQTTLHGGKQEGVDLLTIDNGVLTITVVLTRGMSILDVRSGAMRLGWNSPIKEVVHPQFINLESRGGLGWLEGFNETVVRCGLEFAGHPGQDEFIDGAGVKSKLNLTLHGKIGNIPASEVEVLVDRDPPHRIRVRGLVHERTFHGPKLEILTELSTEPGSDSFRIDDTVTNRATTAQEFQLIYHSNFGAPLLEKGATVVAPIKQIGPMEEHAAQFLNQYGTYEGPTPGFIEQVYLITPLADNDGRTTVLLRNAAKDRGASITWSTRQLPCLTIWKNTEAEADGYVTGLEPGTGFPFNRKVERRFGRVPKLAPGESRQFGLDFGLHPTAETVSKVAARIAEIQGTTTPQLEEKPPAHDE